MFSDVITLIALNESAGEYGQIEKEETRRDLLCKLKSVRSKEFYEAKTVGLHPEIVAVLADYYDYQDERIAEIGGRRMRIERTYRVGNRIELTLTRVTDG